MTEGRAKRRRWFSFSLRSLFVLVSLAAIGLGWVAYERRQSQREMKIAWELQVKGAYVVAAGLFGLDDPSIEPGRWRDIFSQLLGPRVQFVSLKDSPLDDLSLLAGLSHLETVYVGRRKVVDLAPLSGKKTLITLDLGHTETSDLTPLSELRGLIQLGVEENPIRDISPLAGLIRRQILHLAFTHVSDLTPLVGLERLEALSLDGTNVKDLTPLAGLKNLRKIHVTGTPVSEEQVKLLQNALPNCTIVFHSSLADASRQIRSHEYDYAIDIINDIIEANPNTAEAYNLRAVAWKYKGEFDNMIQDCTEAIRINPKFVEAYHNRGRAWRGKKEYDKTIEDFIQATQVDPTYGGAFNSLGWLRATFPDPKYRDGKQAVEYATKACELADWKNGEWLGTLAAAYAEVGDFDKAVESQKKAIELAGPDDVDGLREQLVLYEEHQPYRQTHP